MASDSENPIEGAQEELGEMFELPEEAAEVEDTEDGGAIVILEEESVVSVREMEFYANLAEELPEGDMDELAQSLVGLISKDKEARKKRDEQYEEGIRRTGLGDDAPGGASHWTRQTLRVLSFAVSLPFLTLSIYRAAFRPCRNSCHNVNHFVKRTKIIWHFADDFIVDGQDDIVALDFQRHHGRGHHVAGGCLHHVLRQ